MPRIPGVTSTSTSTGRGGLQPVFGESVARAQLGSQIAEALTLEAHVAADSTHSLAIDIDGTTYYVMLTNVAPV